MVNFKEAIIQSTIALGALCAATSLAAFGARTIVVAQTPTGTKGVIAKNVYISPECDFRVVVPNAAVPGHTARDEGDDEVWQVVFTDDFGGFYRLLSLKNPKGEFTAEGVLGMKNYAQAFDKEVLETTRGREIRFIDVEKQGAEITIKTARKLPDGSIEWDSMTPDLVTANAVFEANGHLYHGIAGVAQMEKMDQQTAVQRAKERLAKFLGGFESGKPGRQNR
jgi:hypothetical protein